jgi:hypothetical protein
MKKLTLTALAVVFAASLAGTALADSNYPACKGKKCKGGHHWHKKDAKTNTSPNTTTPSK